MRKSRFKLRSSIVIAIWPTLAAQAAENTEYALTSAPVRASSTPDSPGSHSTSKNHAATDIGSLKKIALDVTINGQEIAYAVFFFQDKEGRLYADKKTLHRLRIDDAELDSVHASGLAVYPLDQKEKLAYLFDETAQSVEIRVVSEYVYLTRMPSVEFERAELIDASQGWFLNYDANLFGSSDQRSQFAGLVDGAAPVAAGLFALSVIADSANGRPKLSRNQTYWVRDEPDQLRSLRIGDSVGKSQGWGRSVPFVGI